MDNVTMTVLFPLTNLGLSAAHFEEEEEER